MLGFVGSRRQKTTPRRLAHMDSCTGCNDPAGMPNQMGRKAPALLLVSRCVRIGNDDGRYLQQQPNQRELYNDI
jgi:hypothetical protein